MSRNASGTYTLPSGNPVVSGTLIEATWANDTLSDLASAMTDSLSRSGQGGMTAALRLYDGTSSVPGLAWGSETTTGWYRAGAGDMRLVITGSQVIQYLSTGVAITGTLSASGNATVGGTLGVTGATTLTGALTINGGIANNPTITAGTANGVTYLNGSKVLTSGSALTFDGTGKFGVSSATGSASPTPSELQIATTTSASDWSTSSPWGRLSFYSADTSLGAKTQAAIDTIADTTTGGFSSLAFSLSDQSSGVLTERVRITSAGTVGIGTSSPTRLLSVSGSSQGVATFKSTSTTRGYITFQDANTTNDTQVGIGAVANNLVFLSSGASEGMRLTSTGLGIGTSSPAAKLVSSGSSSTNFKALILRNGDGTTGSSASIDFEASSGTEGAEASMAGRIAGVRTGSGTSGALTFSTTNAGVLGERARIDSSGNLGLGVVPSSWATSTGTQALQIGSGGVSIYGTGSGWSAAAFMYLSNNAYYSSSAWRYLRSVASAQYVQASGEHQWFNAGSGTAGNAISFTQAMTLDASGNLGVGTTSPDSTIKAERNDSTVYTSTSTTAAWPISSSSAALTVRNANTTSGSGSYIGLANTSGGATNLAYIGAVGSTSFSPNLVFGVRTGTATYAERARIDSSGNLLVGTTTTLGTAATTISGVSKPGLSIDVDNTANALIRFYSSSTIRGSVTTNGTTVAYNTSSDYRLKNTIAPMTGALAKVAALKPCTYKWNADGSDGEGFIAHELAEVVPQCVAGEKDAVDAEGNPVYQGIDTSFLVATLTAALQELKAEVDALKSEINTLKGI